MGFFLKKLTFRPSKRPSLADFSPRTGFRGINNDFLCCKTKFFFLENELKGLNSYWLKFGKDLFIISALKLNTKLQVFHTKLTHTPTLLPSKSRPKVCVTYVSIFTQL